jgi:hypothetical protein
LDQERPIWQLFDSYKYLLHPIPVAESDVAHITTEYEIISISPWQRVIQSFRMKMGLEIVAGQTVFLSSFHLSFEAGHAIGTVIFAPDERVPGFNRLSVHIARYYHPPTFCFVTFEYEEHPI